MKTTAPKRGGRFYLLIFLFSIYDYFRFMNFQLSIFNFQLLIVNC